MTTTAAESKSRPLGRLSVAKHWPTFGNVWEQVAPTESVLDEIQTQGTEVVVELRGPDAPLDEADDLGWHDLLRAAEATSFRFLADEDDAEA